MRRLSRAFPGTVSYRCNKNFVRRERLSGTGVHWMSQVRNTKAVALISVALAAASILLPLFVAFSGIAVGRCFFWHVLVGGSSLALVGLGLGILATVRADPSSISLSLGVLGTILSSISLAVEISLLIVPFVWQVFGC